MGLFDRLRGKNPEPPPQPSPELDSSAWYAPIEKADQDLYQAVMHLKGLAEEVLSGRSAAAAGPAELAAQRERCNEVASAWIAGRYTLPPFLVQEYGKAWWTDNGREMFETVCRAIPVAEPEVAQALRTALERIAVAGTAMVVHGFFAMMNPGESPAATRHAIEATADAKTYIFGL
ncbi:MAG TPA: hypothetical protein VM778_13975 [Gemmatimonadota bacterium]|nr:hypothetical protein [Gemmatimonadota bacterium]